MNYANWDRYRWSFVLKRQELSAYCNEIFHIYESMSKAWRCQGSLCQQQSMCVNKAGLITSVWLLINNRFPQLNSKTPAQTHTSRRSTQVCQTFLIMKVTLKQTTWLNRLYCFSHSLQWMQTISKSSQSHAQLMWWIAHCSPVFLLSSCAENIAFTFHSKYT